MMLLISFTDYDPMLLADSTLIQKKDTKFSEAPNYNEYQTIASH